MFRKNQKKTKYVLSYLNFLLILMIKHDLKVSEKRLKYIIKKVNSIKSTYCGEKYIHICRYNYDLMKNVYWNREINEYLPEYIFYIESLIRKDKIKHIIKNASELQ